MTNLLVLILMLLGAGLAEGAATKYKLLNPKTGQVVSGPHSNLTAIIEVSHADLRHTSDGGFVEHASGYDIWPSSTNACADVIPFEREKYVSNGSVGYFLGWFKPTSVSQAGNYYFCWGDSGVSSDLATPGTAWSSNHVFVYHMGDGSTCGVNDSKQGLNLTNNGSVGATTGIINGACGSYSTSASLERADGAELDGITGGMTLSAWVYLTNYSDYRVIICKPNSSDLWRHFCLVSNNGTGELLSEIAVGSGTRINGGSTAVIPLNTWTHVALTYDGSNSQTWINGVADGSPVAATGSMTPTDIRMEIGRFYAGGGTFNPWNGYIDEVIMQDTARSAGYIETMKNANIASTFWDIGATQNVPAGGRRSRVIRVQ